MLLSLAAWMPADWMVERGHLCCDFSQLRKCAVTFSIFRAAALGVCAAQEMGSMSSYAEGDGEDGCSKSKAPPEMGNWDADAHTAVS